MAAATARTDYKSRVYLAMNYISANIERELSLDEVAASARFSPFHFHRIFKAVAGENVAEFARRLRLELAAGRLQAYPREAVTSIGLSCGFSSSQNFAKAFKQRYGMSPSSFRAGGLGLREGPPARPAEPPRIEAARDVVVGEVPAAKAATVRRVGAYREACPAAFSHLLAWAKGRIAIGPGSLMALYWDNPEVTPEDRCRFDCCLLAPEGSQPSGEVFMQEVGGGKWASCRFEARGDEIGEAWAKAFRWLVESGYGCRPIPCREVYHNDARYHPENKWIFDIAIPLQDE